MGYGDEIMVTGVARQRGRRIAVLDRNGTHRWHPLWLGNPLIAAPGQAGEPVANGPGCRPYIDYARTTAARWAYTTWRCWPGDLPAIAPDPAGGGGILIEPHIKPQASPNKRWPWERWQALVDLNRSLPWLQLGPPGTRMLKGVRTLQTADFESAVRVLAGCAAAVLPEGGLHHAAAALGVPTVVLFGGMTSPRNTGYTDQTSLWVDDPAALGWRIEHPACAAAWDRITPQIAMEALCTRTKGK